MVSRATRWVGLAGRHLGRHPSCVPCVLHCRRCGITPDRLFPAASSNSRSYANIFVRCQAIPIVLVAALGSDAVGLHLTDAT